MCKKIGVVLLLLMLLTSAGCASIESMDQKVEKWTGGKIAFYYESGSNGHYVVCVERKARYVETDRFLFSTKINDVLDIDPASIFCNK